MKISIAIVITLLIAGCLSTPQVGALWSRSIATDVETGQQELLDLDGLLMEWSASGERKGFLYPSLPLLKGKMWTFVEGGTPKNNALEVVDGDVVTAVYQTGRKFQIRIEAQTPYFVKVMYREI